MKMSAHARARLAFGLTLAAAVVGGITWYYWPAQHSILYELRTREAVSGLIDGAPVEFHGVQVGKVHEVKLVDPRTVRVLMEIRKDAPVTTATVASVTARGLAARGFTGYVYVSLEDQGSGGRPLAAANGSRYPVIASVPGQAVALDSTIKELSGRVEVVMDLMQQLLDRNTIASLKQSAAALDRVTRTLADNNERIETILANAERASERVQPLLASTGQALDTVQGKILPRAQQTLVGIDALSGFATEHLAVIFTNTERATTRLEPLLDSGTATVRAVQTQILPEAHRSLVRIEHLTGSLDDTLVKVKRNPAVLLRGTSPIPAGPGEAR